MMVFREVRLGDGDSDWVDDCSPNSADLDRRGRDSLKKVKLGKLRGLRIPSHFIRITHHAVKRFKERVKEGREGEGVNRNDLKQFVEDSVQCSRRNLKIVRDATKRKKCKWYGESTTHHMVFEVGVGAKDRWVVFPVVAGENHDGSLAMVVPTCWVVRKLYPNP